MQNPLRPDLRDCAYAAFLPGETLGRYVERVGIRMPSRHVNVWHNGRRVPEELWTRLIPRQGDHVLIAPQMQGGGGGGKILRTVALIALVVVSAGYGAAVGGALGFTGATAGAIGSSIIMLGGTLLINALIPMPLPTAAKLGVGEKYESSPTYSIQGGRNRPRPWETMLLVFGRHKVVPDLGSSPYNQQMGDDQYLNQVFHFGLQGISVALSDFRIGDTPVYAYQGVQMQVSAPDGKLAMFPGNVDTMQGFAISQADGWVSRTTPPNVTNIWVEFASRLFRVNDDGTLATRSVDVRVQFRRVGTDTWIEYGTIDAVFATHYWSAVVFPERTQIDFGSVNPADHVDGESFIIQDPDNLLVVRTGQWQWKPHPFQLGQPWQGIAPDPLITPGAPGNRFFGGRQEPTRAAISWGVPEGQYEVRVMKATPDINDSRESNETAVSQILAFQTDTADYSGQCRVALRIKATGQLNGVVDEFSAIATAWCSVWTGSAWDFLPTSNPAWWFLYFARGGYNAAGNRIFGGGLSDSQIDIEGIKAWAAWCDQKRLTFDYVLDRKMSAAAVLQMIARAGRATMSYQTGKLGVVWDAEALPITAMFGPFNIKAGSFKIAYLNEGTVDEVVVNFIDKDAGWTMGEVRVMVPGALSTNNPLQLDLDGCTNSDMAGREANLIAASQVFRRRKITWETDLEGLVCTRGDVVNFSHDLTVWGYSGRLAPGSHGGGTPTLVLTQAVATDGTGIILLRDPHGNMWAGNVTSAVGEVSELTIVSPLGGFPLPGDPGYEDYSPFDWAWQFDPIETPGRRFKVTSVTPAGDGIRFEATDEDYNYYLSETNPYAYTPPRDGTLLGGIVFSVEFSESIRNVASDLIDVQIGWVLSASNRVQVNYSINGVAQDPITTMERRVTVQAKTGDVIVATVRPVNQLGTGTPLTRQYNVQGLLAPLPAVTGLSSVFRDGLTTLVWNRVVDIRQPDYEVRLGSSWADSRTIGTTANLEMLAVGNGLYFVAARFRTGATTLYGPPDSLQISGAVLVRNVLVTVNEDPEWTGILDTDSELIVADMPQYFGDGDGVKDEFRLPVDELVGDPSIFRRDWQGDQLLYTTPRTNLVRQSVNLAISPWTTTNYAAYATAVPTLRGSSTAFKIRPNAGTGLSGGGFTQAVAKSAIAQRFTWSVFAKAAEFDRIRIYLNGQDTVNASARGDWRLTDGALIATNVGSAFSDLVVLATPYSGGWWRFSITVTSDAHTAITARIYALSSTTTVGDGISGILVDSPQLEVSDAPTSVIDTVASAVTVTDYSISSSNNVVLAVPPLAGALLLWTGGGYRVTPRAFVFDGELTLAPIGDILQSGDVLSLDDVLWFGGVVSSGTYQTADENIVDIGYVTNVRVDFTIDAYALNFGENVLSLVDVLAEQDILNGSNQQHYSITPQIQFAQDDGVFGPWQDYVPGTIQGRYFRVRLVLQTDDPLIVPFVRHFSWTIDVPDLVQTGTGVTVPSGGLRISFPKEFHTKPNLQVTTLDAVAGDRAVIQQTVDPLLGFNIQMFNNATPVSRVINWLAQGY
nr:host specificity factor TipJ family phage tail protein [Achromobacter sp. ACRQX]